MSTVLDIRLKASFGKESGSLGWAFTVAMGTVLNESRSPRLPATGAQRRAVVLSPKREGGDKRLKASELLEIGWLEGMIDGEGCIYLSKCRRRTRRGFVWIPFVKISNTNLVGIEKAREIIRRFTNRGSVVEDDYHDRPTRKPCYNLVVGGGKSVRSLLSNIQLVMKEKQRLLTIEACNLLHENMRVGGNNRWHYAPPPNDVRLEEIYQELHALNRRGRK